tara:strand:- start:35 stop:340 length:306 start_codon:yes stop_codon:yes gene_type:complete
MMNRPMYKKGGETLKKVPAGKKGKGLKKLPKAVRNKIGFKKRWKSKIMKNFLCWPSEIIRTAYTKLVDKVFGKRCRCANIESIKQRSFINVCTDCGKKHNG